MNSSNTASQIQEDGNQQKFLTLTTTNTKTEVNAVNYLESDIDTKIASLQAQLDQWKGYKALFHPQE